MGGGETRGKGTPARCYRNSPPQRGALILLRDCGASRDGGEVVNVVRYILGIVKKAAMARRGVGSRSFSPSPSDSAAEQVVKHRGRSRPCELCPAGCDKPSFPLRALVCGEVCVGEVSNGVDSFEQRERDCNQRGYNDQRVRAGAEREISDETAAENADRCNRKRLRADVNWHPRAC